MAKVPQNAKAVAILGLLICSTGPSLAESRIAPTKPEASYSRPSKWKFETPVVGTDQWKKEEAERAKLDKQTEKRLLGVCGKC